MLIIEHLSEYGNPDIVINFQKEINRRLEIIRFQPYVNMVALQLHEYEFRKSIIKGNIFIYHIDK